MLVDDNPLNCVVVSASTCVDVSAPTWVVVRLFSTVVVRLPTCGGDNPFTPVTDQPRIEAAPCPPNCVELNFPTSLAASFPTCSSLTLSRATTPTPPT